MAPNTNSSENEELNLANKVSDPTANGVAKDRYARFVNKVSQRRQPSIIRELLKILAEASEDMIPLSGGLPNPAMFPFEKVEVTLKTGPGPGSEKLSIEGNALNHALQYLPTQGHGGLLKKLRNLQCKVNQQKTYYCI